MLLSIENRDVALSLDDVEIYSEDIPGWLVANEGKYTVALDITITDELKQEGIARELINRIQNLRKDSGLEVTDKITIEIKKHNNINDAIVKHSDYISSQTLARDIKLVDQFGSNDSTEISIDDETHTMIRLRKI
jgi:isoleucyl-tRNA synthetase